MVEHLEHEHAIIVSRAAHLPVVEQRRRERLGHRVADARQDHYGDLGSQVPMQRSQQRFDLGCAGSEHARGPGQSEFGPRSRSALRAMSRFGG